MKKPPPESFFPHSQVAIMEGVRRLTIVRRLKRGEYGPLVTRDGRGFFIPASGIDARRQRHRILDLTGVLIPQSRTPSAWARREALAAARTERAA